MYTHIINTQSLLFVFENIIMVNPTATENITAKKETRKLFDDVKSNLSNKEKKVIRRKLYKKRSCQSFLQR